MYNNYNPYYFQQPVQRPQGLEQVPQQPTYIQPITKPIGLLGKSVDSIDVVRAMDIPLDGSISYFPLTDGSAIVTKQLRTDGTSKTVVYKPVEDDKETPAQNYMTVDEFNQRFAEINIDEIEELMEEFKDVKKDIKDLKTKLKGKGD